MPAAPSPESVQTLTRTGRNRWPVSLAPHSLAVADFNGDGREDVVVAARGRGFNGSYSCPIGEVLVLLNLGDDTWDTSVVYSGCLPTVAALDVNGDGAAGLIVGGKARGPLLVNDGASQFAAVTEELFGSDLFVAASGAGQDVWSHISNGSFVSPTSLSLHRIGSGGVSTIHEVAPWVDGSPLAAGDFDGDGTNELLVLDGAALKTMPSSDTFSVSGDARDVRSALAADLDGDGVHELLAARREPARIDHLALSGDAFRLVSSTPIDALPDAMTTWSRTEGGALELALAFSAAQRVVSLRSSDGGFNEATNWSVGRGAIALAQLDIDSDGRNELLVVERDDNTVALLDPEAADALVRNERLASAMPNCAFQRVRGFDALPTAPARWVLADVDEDGRADLVTPSPDRFALHVFRNLGQGFAPDATELVAFDNMARVDGLAAGDLDGDGDTDLSVRLNDYSVWDGGGTAAALPRAKRHPQACLRTLQPGHVSAH